MSLAAGSKLGPYEILAPIGAGGMGEVYRARDPRMGREVAIKISAERFSDRFSREGRAVAALNHPNICHLYDVGPDYLVMELVEGPTLAERIREGAVPLEEALGIARQIADALEAAHEKGIVHRDLKPGNIKLRPDGTVKVLDFGLAKMGDASEANARAESSPTFTLEAASRVGMILGTAAYMAPEQARGKPVDKRADIWAFGVVLYEMLTGRRLFDGEDISETLAKVIQAEPRWDGIPARARRLLRKCLEKDPKRRLRDIGDAWELVDGSGVPDAPALRTGNPRAWVAWTAAAALGVAAAAAGLGWWRATRPAFHPLVRLSVDLGADAVPGPRVTAVLSPDGTRIVFPVQPRGGGGLGQLATRLLDQPTATPIRGTEEGANPFFSPDGQWLGFVANGRLRKVAVQGGAAVTLCDAVNMRGGSWGEDGNIVFAQYDAGLQSVSAAGGVPQPLTRPSDFGESRHVWPQILPGGSAVLFCGAPAGSQSAEDDDIEVLSFKTGRKKVLLHGGYAARYLPTAGARGHLVYLHEATLFGVPFDPERLELSGTPAPLVDDIGANANAGSGQFSFSETGTFVYLGGKSSAAPYPIVWLDSDGKTTPLVAQPGIYDAPRFSPDGKRLAYLANTGKNDDVFVYDLAGGTSTQLTFTAPGNFELAWAPDGKHLVFGESSTTGSALWWIRADRSGEPQKLLDGKLPMRPQSFSPDGKRLAFVQNSTGGNPDVWMLPLDLADRDHPKAGTPEAYLTGPQIEVDAAFSPDGRWLAYSSGDTSAKDEIYVRPSATGAGGKWKVSTQGGKFPAWSHDGRALLFLGGDDRIMVTEYAVKGDAFAFSRPRAWSDKQIMRRSTRQNFDLAPDGKRVAAIPRPDVEERAGTLHVTFLLNFFDEVRRRVPSEK